jgi:putative phosphoribosyl transferase
VQPLAPGGGTYASIPKGREPSVRRGLYALNERGFRSHRAGGAIGTSIAPTVAPPERDKMTVDVPAEARRPVVRDHSAPSIIGADREVGVRREVSLPLGDGHLTGDLSVPATAVGVAIFAHGSGSDRRSPRNLSVAAELQGARLGTLLLDLLTPEEARVDAATGRYRFDLPRLADRLVGAVDACARWPETAGKGIGLFGASTGGAAALVAAARRAEDVRAVVLRGARSDLAGPDILRVRAPTLFLVGERDPEVRMLNETSFSRLSAPKELVVVPGASHLFEETGALEEVARRTRDWFLQHLVVPS